MAIEIPNAAKEAAFRDYHGDTDRGYGEISDYDLWAMGAAIEAALPHLIPAITADLAQRLIDWTAETHYEDVTSVYKTSMTPLLTVMCEALDALAALAGTERGDDGKD